MKVSRIIFTLMTVVLMALAICANAQDDGDAVLDDLFADMEQGDAADEQISEGEEEASLGEEEAVLVEPEDDPDEEADLDSEDAVEVEGGDADDDAGIDDLLGDAEAEEDLADDAAAAIDEDTQPDAGLDDLLGDLDSEDAVEVEGGDADGDAGIEDLLGELDQDDDVVVEDEAAVAVEDETALDASEEMAEEVQTLTPEQIEQQRVVALQAAEEEGKIKLREANDLIGKRRYEQALAALREARSKLPERPANDAIIAEIDRKIARAQIEMAEMTLRRGDFENAASQLADARKLLENLPRDDASDLMSDIEKLAGDVAKAERRFDRENAPEALELARIEEDESTLDGLISSGKRMMRLGQYDKAETYFKQALNLDPYDKDAMRLLRKLDEDRLRISTIERDATVSRMVRDVRDSWNPPIEVELASPVSIDAGRERYTRTETQELRKKMEAIVIPSIEFRQANIVDVIDFLREASSAADPSGVGVNIISKIPEGRAGGGGGASSSEPEPFAAPADDFDPWADLSFDAEQPERGRGTDSRAGGGTVSSSIPTITLNLRRVSLMDAIKYVTEVAGLKYRLEKNVVIITPADAVEGQIITRLYPVQPSFLDVVVTRSDDDQNRRGGGGGGQFIEMGAATTQMSKSDVKEFFQNSGVQFPTGTSITYNSTISQLIVSNTPENLEVFESILAQLNVVPKQVEIETRFVEVAQNDLEEIGFEWLLNDNYEMLVKDGAGPIGGRERIVMGSNASTGGFTSGLRYFDATESGLAPFSPTDGALGGVGAILGISSVLTNPEVSMVLHALDQKGGSDLLSAPRVTTRSGVNAEIKVVREIIYPTEFDNEVQNVETTDEAGRRINTRQIIVTPEGFETRETGVIMNVTPTVGPDGYTIDLSMVPEVVELVDWIQYGTDIYNMPQPIFSKRTVATSIIIWDGQTVVMGGMIREQITTVDDKIPLLGDIPLLGRLFRNKGEYSQKQNLLIFVTARLVDPAGNRIRKPGEQTVPEQPGA
jgi:general secretion pathway protein D